jgi:dTDP-4-amino-4,6-dideoxygalactose transaminase
VTDETSARALALPLYTHMKLDVLEEVARTIAELLG